MHSHPHKNSKSNLDSKFNSRFTTTTTTTTNLSQYKITLFFEELTIRSWWVVLFIILCYAAYEQGVKTHKVYYNQLNKQFIYLKEKENTLLNKQKELQGQILSQTDPLWIEMTLIKELGLVPEGQTKIFFFKPGPL